MLLLVVAAWQFYPYVGDLKELYAYRDRVSYLWMAVAIVAQIAQYGTEGYFINELLGILGYQIARKDTIRISALEVFADRLFPVGQFGSLGAFVYFYRQLGVSTDAIIYLNASSSLVALSVVAILFLLSAASLHTSALDVPIDTSLLDAAAVVVAALAVALMVALRSKPVREALNSFLQRFSWYTSLRKSADELRDLHKVVLEQRWKYLGFAICKALCFYAIDVAILRSCLQAFGTSVPLPLVVDAYVISLVAGLMSFLPGGLGTTDAALGIIFLSAQVDPTIVVGVILLYRVVTFVLPIPVGAAAYLSLNADLNKRNGK